MDIYVTSLALGGVGLASMAVSGVGRHGTGHRSGSARGSSHTHGAPHAPGAPHAHSSAQTPGAPHAHAHGPVGRDAAARTLMAVMSPRLLFSVCLGLGTSGLLLQHLLAGRVLFAAALAGGVVFERLLVNPIWNLSVRFASQPALTLESAVTSEATAVTTFDANGQGLITVEVDGQIMQVLGTLQRADRELGARVRVGAKVRIEDVDVARNRCTVSLL